MRRRTGGGVGDERTLLLLQLRLDSEVRVLGLGGGEGGNDQSECGRRSEQAGDGGPHGERAAGRGFERVLGAGEGDGQGEGETGWVGRVAGRR